MYLRNGKYKRRNVPFLSSFRLTIFQISEISDIHVCESLTKYSMMINIKIAVNIVIELCI